MSEFNRMNSRYHVLLQNVAELRGKLEHSQRDIRRLDQTTKAVVAQAGPTVNQMLRNGDWGHSWDTHENAAPAATDVRFEAWEVYTHDAPTAGQQLLEDSVFSGALVAASTALPDVGRSDAPVLDPDWSRTYGFARLGSNRTIDFFLDENRIYPGRLYYLSLIAARRTANVVIPGNLYAGIWDNTAGKRDWLPASTFTINARTEGLPAAITSRDYLVVGRTDYGRTITSAVVTVADAPSDASFISGRVYVELSWSPIKGVINWDIYRLTGGVYLLLSQESTLTVYFDQGASRRTVTGYPSTIATNMIAYTETRAGALAAMPVDGVNPSWQQYDLVIASPPTYDQSATTGKQCLRVGFTEALAGTDAAHGVLIDLITLSLNAGSFAPHPDDKGAQQPIAAPNGSTQGGAGSGGSGFTPPGGGSGGQRCLAPEMEVLTVDERLGQKWIAIGALCGTEQIVSPVNGQLCISEIEQITEGHTERMLTVRVMGASLRCSPSEPFIQTLSDRTGIEAERLLSASPLLTYQVESATLGIVPTMRKPSVSRKGGRIIMLTLLGEHKTFIARAPGSPVAFVIHNLKSIGSIE